MPINTTAAYSAARFVDIPRKNLDQKFAEGFKVAVVAGFATFMLNLVLLWMGRSIPVGRKGRPEEIAGMVRFLVSEEGAYMTGQTVNVNGGLAF